MSGYKPGSTQFGSIGAVFGEKSHTQTVAEMPSHTHIQDQHRHTMLGDVNNAAPSINTSEFSLGPAMAASKNLNTGYTVATNQYTGGGQAFNVIQPTRAVLVVIKT